MGLGHGMNPEETPHHLHLTPNWVLIGGILLAFMASAVNVEFMINVGVSVSHHTGDIAKITTEMNSDVASNLSKILLLAASVIGFVVGAAFAGYFIHHTRLDIGRPYGRSITSIGLLLLAAYFVRSRSIELSILLAAIGCGMQNGLATHYRGIILRTTHVTGLLTDLGVLLGMRAHGRKIETWKAVTHGALIAAFCLGAIISSWINLNSDVPTLAILGGLYAVGGGFVTLAKRFFGTTD